jgi:hypothetical protein
MTELISKGVGILLSFIQNSIVRVFPLDFSIPFIAVKLLLAYEPPNAG